MRGECVKGDSQIVKSCSFGREPHTILRRVRKWNRHNVAQLPAELLQTERRRRHGPKGADIGRRRWLSFVEAVEELEAAARWLTNKLATTQRQSTQEEKLVLKPCTNKYNGVPPQPSSGFVCPFLVCSTIETLVRDEHAALLHAWNQLFCHKMAMMLLKPRCTATKSGGRGGSSFITNAVSA